jgi:ribosomal protein L34E
MKCKACKIKDTQYGNELCETCMTELIKDEFAFTAKYGKV